MHGQQTPLASTVQPATRSLATTQLVDVSSSSSGLLNISSDLFGLRDIIDLMSMVLLDSPQA
ncbi:hypothetical protein KSC_110620 [Ktedonobacter sp. SOSP1-52]|uniref:hypothetical protein n=1 Tax=Ktedonobacter sp. SOSP1-52 TaxID=2778366 RepID=UPI001916B317|nr:hypothetical protein [Ktedonobacter sp. SOSP1-52]GHO72170.1 hypothetical protein KSC_110620 [Ktedonobacter sp. SOSP1-52]